VFLGAATAKAGKTADAQNEYMRRYEPVLKAVPNLELPAKAAALVKQADKKAKEPVALAVIHIVSRINPAATPAVVGAIRQSEPEIAPKVADEAARLQPKLSPEIKAASTARPAPTSLPDPVPTDGATRRGPTSAGDPEPTPGRGKKKGHYKNP